MLERNAMLEQLNRYYTVWQACNAVYEDWAKAHGLSANSLMVLSALHEGGEACTQKKISQRWSIPKQTTNMILKELERKGYVALLPMREDKRNKQIRLTPSGHDYADAIITRLRRVEMYVVEQMGLERMKQLNENTALFVSLFGKAGKEAEGENDESCE